jgi:phosphoenolpyruvate synthase/pyruvate phosphate dikinase
VRANADTPHDAQVAREFGAEGIGLCRTEHMFFGDERLAAMREMILAEGVGAREKALAKLLPLQRKDFEGIFRAMACLPVTIRLLDPPLHEFLPNHEELLGELAELKMALQRAANIREMDRLLDEIAEKRELLGKVEHLRENNPMLGYRGCFRNIHEPDLFGLELQAIAQVREDFDNLHLMIPFVRTRWEFADCKRLVDESGLTHSKGFQLWVMAEVPSIVYWLPEYAALGATGVSIGSNDLTQLVLGVDRDSQFVAPVYDERDEAVLDAIYQIIQAAHAHGMTASICGQAPSVYPDYAEKLVRWGIDSISVTPDVVDRTRRNMAMAEQRILLEGVWQRGAAPAPQPHARLSRSNGTGDGHDSRPATRDAPPRW